MCHFCGLDYQQTDFPFFFFFFSFHQLRKIHSMHSLVPEKFQLTVLPALKYYPSFAIRPLPNILKLFIVIQNTKAQCLLHYSLKILIGLKSLQTGQLENLIIKRVLLIKTTDNKTCFLKYFSILLLFQPLFPQSFHLHG